MRTKSVLFFFGKLQKHFVFKNGLRNKKVYKNSSVELKVEIDTSYTEEFVFKWKKNEQVRRLAYVRKPKTKQSAKDVKKGNLVS